jgi:radical SAM/Cys-rich protein
MTSPGFAQTLAAHRVPLTRVRPEILQINVGKLCNLTCIHCHVNAGPARKEIITRETLEKILAWLRDQPGIHTVDLTGGAPEMIPDFRWLISQLRALRPELTLIDRCNLTILLEPGYEDLAGFLAAHRVQIMASMPCYSPENVNAQRGDGVFEGSIQALQWLNTLGYGRTEALPLHLVYNPNGASLPGPQEELEADYKRELKKHFGIDFHRLYTITNLPVSRFKSWLKNNGKLEGYMQLLLEHFNPATVEGLMCRNTINVDWRGWVYDCDFNQQLGLRLGHDRPLALWELTLELCERLPIQTGPHCYGCTAGAGSSCGGALL